MKNSVLSVLCILGTSLGAQNLKVSPKAYQIPSTKHFNAAIFQVENSCYVRIQDFEKIPQFDFTALLAVAKE